MWNKILPMPFKKGFCDAATPRNWLLFRCNVCCVEHQFRSANSLITRTVFDDLELIKRGVNPISYLFYFTNKGFLHFPTRLSKYN